MERVELKSLKELISNKCEKVVFDQLLKDHNQLHGDLQNKLGNLNNSVEEMEYKHDRKIKSIENTLETKADSSYIKESFDKVSAREKLNTDALSRV